MSRQPAALLSWAVGELALGCGWLWFVVQDIHRRSAAAASIDGFLAGVSVCAAVYDWWRWRTSRP